MKSLREAKNLMTTYCSTDNLQLYQNGIISGSELIITILEAYKEITNTKDDKLNMKCFKLALPVVKFEEKQRMVLLEKEQTLRRKLKATRIIEGFDY